MKNTILCLSSILMAFVLWGCGDKDVADCGYPSVFEAPVKGGAFAFYGHKDCHVGVDKGFCKTCHRLYSDPDYLADTEDYVSTPCAEHNWYTVFRKSGQGMFTLILEPNPLPIDRKLKISITNQSSKQIFIVKQHGTQN